MILLLVMLFVPPELIKPEVPTAETMQVGDTIVVSHLDIFLFEDDLYVSKKAKQFDAGVVELTLKSDGYHLTFYHMWLEKDYPKYKPYKSKPSHCFPIKSTTLVKRKRR